MRIIFIIELWAIMNSILNELCLTLTDIKKTYLDHQQLSSKLSNVFY